VYSIVAWEPFIDHYADIDRLRTSTEMYDVYQCTYVLVSHRNKMTMGIRGVRVKGSIAVRDVPVSEIPRLWDRNSKLVK